LPAKQEEKGGTVAAYFPMTALCYFFRKQASRIMSKLNNSSKKLGVLIGGSGLIGGYLMHYFKTKTPNEIEIRAPNSKKLSLREPQDIIGYVKRHKPDFIINSAIASLNSDAHLTYEINYLGSIYLARAAMAMNIPYIHISSAVTLPPGEDLTEDDHLPLDRNLSNYAKSKLMTEMTLQHMHKSHGLDYTMIRLAIVYGQHDHKIQGVHRLLFSIIDHAMPFMLTKKGVKHSYTNANMIPYFVHHLLLHREEFSGQLYHFVDPEPVELARLILTIKSYMEINTPKEIYVPYHVAKFGKVWMEWMIKILSRFGVKALVPPEALFLENFYKTQTLSSEKLRQSSFVSPNPGATIFAELPSLIDYYLSRWEHLNLFTTYENKDFVCPHNKSEEFLNSPQDLLRTTHADGITPLYEVLDP
jgi:nucleoside-diphosphate-sugar epimerase